MNSFKRILVPVDLSDNNSNAIALATNMAKCNDAKLVFCYVALPPLEQAAMHGKEEMDSLILREHSEFNQIQPPDLSVPYEHVFRRGNPGPEIVQAVQDSDCDLIVLASHGRAGFVRWLMGSVAEYVMRNAECPVLTLKIQTDKENKDRYSSDSLTSNKSKSPFVTSAMDHSVAIRDYNEMSDVIVELSAADSTAAPVVDGLGNCIGILTNTDIDRYLDLRKRLEQKDKSVIDQVFETDRHGMRRMVKNSFHQVKRHMTAPVVTISANSTCAEATKLFAQNQEIHHLVVVDDSGRPIGIVEPNQVDEISKWNIDESVTTNH